MDLEKGVNLMWHQIVKQKLKDTKRINYRA